MFDSATELKTFNGAMTARYSLGVKHLRDIDGQRILGQLYTRTTGGLIINIHANVSKWCGKCGIVVNDETQIASITTSSQPRTERGYGGR